MERGEDPEHDIFISVHYLHICSPQTVGYTLFLYLCQVNEPGLLQTSKGSLGEGQIGELVALRCIDLRVVVGT